MNHFIAMTELHVKSELEYQQEEQVFNIQCLWFHTEIKDT